MVQPLWKTVWRFLKKLKLELLYNLAVVLLGIYPKKIIIPKKHMHPQRSIAGSHSRVRRLKRNDS